MKFKLVVFDLDGTLLDTIEDLGVAVNHALSLRSLPLHDAAQYRLMVGNGVRKLVQRALPEELSGDGAFVDSMLSDFMDYYCSHIDIHTRPYPGMEALVSELDASGVRLAVASNKFQEGAERLVRGFFPGIPFVRVMGAAEGLPLKPDPAVVLDIVSASGLTPGDTVMVGDSGTDVDTAKAAGVKSIGVAWGFRPDAAARADMYACDAAQLEGYLLG